MSDITKEGYPDIPFNQPEVLQPKKKKNRKVLFSVLIVAFVILGIVGVGFVNKIQQFRHGGPLGMMIEKMTEGIDLDANQKTQVDQIKAEIKAKMEAKKDSRKQGMEEFEGLFRQSTLTKQQLIDLQAKREADKEEMKSFMIDELIKFHDLLNQSQRDKVGDKIKEFRESHKDGMHHGWDKKGKHGKDNKKMETQ